MVALAGSAILAEVFTTVSVSESTVPGPTWHTFIFRGKGGGTGGGLRGVGGGGGGGVARVRVSKNLSRSGNNRLPPLFFGKTFSPYTPPPPPIFTILALFKTDVILWHIYRSREFSIHYTVELDRLSWISKVFVTLNQLSGLLSYRLPWLMFALKSGLLLQNCRLSVSAAIINLY